MTLFNGQAVPAELDDLLGYSVQGCSVLDGDDEDPITRFMEHGSAADVVERGENHSRR